MASQVTSSWRGGVTSQGSVGSLPSCSGGPSWPAEMGTGPGLQDGWEVGEQEAVGQGGQAGCRASGPFLPAALRKPPGRSREETDSDELRFFKAP